MLVIEFDYRLINLIIAHCESWVKSSGKMDDVISDFDVRIAEAFP